MNHEVFLSGRCKQVLFLACVNARDSSFQTISHPPHFDSFLTLSRVLKTCRHLESALLCAALSCLPLSPTDCSCVGLSCLWVLLDSGNPLVTSWVPHPGLWLWFSHKAGSWAVTGPTSPVCQSSGVTAFSWPRSIVLKTVVLYILSAFCFSWEDESGPSYSVFVGSRSVTSLILEKIELCVLKK